MAQDVDGKQAAGVPAPGAAESAVAPTMRIHLWLEGAEGLFFGIGRAQLLERIGAHGSLKQAAAELGMSYRAAWGKIRATETALGEKIIRRSGHRREGHELTEFGKQLMRQFNGWFDAVEEFALESARQRFPWPVRRFVDPRRAPAAKRQ